jgi:hypothetical protein
MKKRVSWVQYLARVLPSDNTAAPPTFVAIMILID